MSENEAQQRAQTQRGANQNSGSGGRSVDRVDGRLKVTGGARFAAEFPVERVAHGALVLSTIAKGRIRNLDTRTAESAPGVLAVITHLNAPKLPFNEAKPREGTAPKVGRYVRVLNEDRIYFNGQPIGVVVAETLEQATHAPSLVRVTYARERYATRVEDEMTRSFPPTEATEFKGRGRIADAMRGNPQQAFASAEARVDNTYTIPIENHNPLEPHATIAAWEGQGGQRRLTLYDKSQWVRNVRKTIFGMPEERVHVISPFGGGAFGSVLRTWHHPVIAAMAAQVVQRPVKLVLTRQQMSTMTASRPYHGAARRALRKPARTAHGDHPRREARRALLRVPQLFFWSNSN